MKSPNNPNSENSGSFEDVGPKIATSDGLVSRRLEGRPVLSAEKNLVLEPVRDVLLSDRPVHVFGETLGKSGLASASGGDGPSKSSNVRFLHDHVLYTNRFVHVNKPVGVTANKEVCTVLAMRTAKTRPAPKGRPSSKRVAVPGPDGKTLGQRVAEAMAFESGRRRASYAQKDLIDDVNRLVRTEDETADMLSQAMASAIMLSKVTRSTFTPYIARACHVDAVWLARGVGQMIPKP